MIFCPKCNPQNFKKTVSTIILVCQFCMGILMVGSEDLLEKTFSQPPYISYSVLGTSTFASGASIGTLRLG